MLNAEKYKNEIIQAEGFFGLFEGRKVVSCNKIKCEYCEFYNDNLNECSSERVLWLLEEYEEPKVDWSKVPVDTKVLASFSEEKDLIPRYFAKYENNNIYVWSYGKTSWSACDKDDCTSVSYVELVEED